MDSAAMAGTLAPSAMASATPKRSRGDNILATKFFAPASMKLPRSGGWFSLGAVDQGDSARFSSTIFDGLAARHQPTRAGSRAKRMIRLEYRNVTMRFSSGGGTITAIRNVSLSVADGEVVAVIGPSGCGKSTLLNIGAGLLAPAEGEALVDGERVEGPNSHVAFMLQKDLLLPWRSIVENVMHGVEIKGFARTEYRRRAYELLDTFRLKEFADHY